MSNLSVAVSGISIHNLNDLYSLNDLYKASGGLEKHKPANWLRNKQTTDLIKEIEKAQIRAIQSKQGLGTFVCKELVVHYGMWISPQFSLKVINAFLATQEHHNTIAPEQQQLLKQAVIDLSVATGEHFQHIYGRLFKEFKIPRYRELLAKDFNAAMEFLSKPVQLPSKPKDTHDVLYIPFGLRRNAWYLVKVFNGKARRHVMSFADMSCDIGKPWGFEC